MVKILWTWQNHENGTPSIHVIVYDIHQSGNYWVAKYCVPAQISVARSTVNPTTSVNMLCCNRKCKYRWLSVYSSHATSKVNQNCFKEPGLISTLGSDFSCFQEESLIYIQTKNLLYLAFLFIIYSSGWSCTQISCSHEEKWTRSNFWG